MLGKCNRNFSKAALASTDVRQPAVELGIDDILEVEPPTSRTMLRESMLHPNDVLWTRLLPYSC